MRIYELFKEQLPSVKTLSVEEIAEKHGVSKQEIKRELIMGVEIEKEHSTDAKLAREIALDHLKELPDYYTRLKKMEGE